MPLYSLNSVMALYELVLLLLLLFSVVVVVVIIIPIYLLITY